MGCIDKIYSVSVVVGDKTCNANCKNCGGRMLRGQSLKDGEVARNLIPACRLAARYGAWSLALTGSGEPTMSPHSVTETLKQVHDAGLQFPFTNLFTNGILLGNKEYANQWLPIWKRYGLTSVAVSVHNPAHDMNCAAYGLKNNEMPMLYEVFDNIKRHGLCPRVTLLLGKGQIDTKEMYVWAINQLHKDGTKLITSWPLVANDGSRIEATPSRWEMAKIRWWLYRNTEPVMGHVWGGQVRAYKGMNVRLTDYVSKHDPSNDFIRQLVVFQNGEVSYSWFQKGMICLA